MNIKCREIKHKMLVKSPISSINNQVPDMTFSSFERRRIYRMASIRQAFLCHLLVLFTVIALSAEPAFSQNDECTNARLQECLQHAKKFEEDSKLLTIPGNQQHYINSLNKSCRSLVKALECFPPLSKCSELNKQYDIDAMNDAVGDQVSVFCELSQFTQTTEYLDHRACIDKSLGEAFECLIEYIKESPVSESRSDGFKSCCARKEKLDCYERTLVKKCHFVPISYPFLDKDRDYLNAHCSYYRECPKSGASLSAVPVGCLAVITASFLTTVL